MAAIIKHGHVMLWCMSNEIDLRSLSLDQALKEKYIRGALKHRGLSIEYTPDMIDQLYKDLRASDTFVAVGDRELELYKECLDAVHYIEELQDKGVTEFDIYKAMFKACAIEIGLRYKISRIPNNAEVSKKNQKNLSGEKSI